MCAGCVWSFIVNIEKIITAFVLFIGSLILANIQIGGMTVFLKLPCLGFSQAAAETDCFQDMAADDGFISGQIRQCPCHTEDAVEAAGGQGKFFQHGA